MNTLKIGCNQEIVYKHQPWQQVGITTLPSEVIIQQEDHQQHMTSYRPQTPYCSKTIMEQIGSPASALLVTERYLGFLQDGVHRSFDENIDVSSVPHMKFDDLMHPKDNGYCSPYDTSYKTSCGNQSEKDQIRELKRKLLDESDVNDSKQSSSPIVGYDGTPDLRGHLGNSTQTLGQVSGNATNQGNVAPSKTQIRWTQDLHDRFVECVNFSGGAESNSEKKTGMDTISKIENITGMQFKDALQMQLAVQRQLHEQLEIQRNLQLRIEEQAKQIKKMYDQHQHQKANKSENSEITFSHDDHHSMNLDDDEILNFEDDYENALSTSKMS